MLSLPLSGRGRAARTGFLLALAGLAAGTTQAAVWLSSSTFAADNLPTLHADTGELAAAQAAAGSGGYYKLRAKFILPYPPGYYQAIDTVNNQGGRLAGSPGAGTYTVQLYWAAYDSTGLLQGTGTFFSQSVTVTPPAGVNLGLQADYFDGNGHQTLVRTVPGGDRPDYDWGSAGPAGTGPDNFSVRWTGQVEPLFSETYTFTTGSDDGMRVYLANLSEPVAGAYWDHGYYEASGSIQLAANTRYQIRVEFFENAGGATARLFWQSPSQPREIIPLSRLLPPGSGSGSPVPPTIATPPQSQTVPTGGTAVFTVVADGAPAPSLQWRKSQIPIPGATGSSLTVSPVQAADAGSYDVVASNVAGSATSSPATLTVSPVAGEGAGSGLRGDYFNGTNFNTAVLTRVDPGVDFPWGSGQPAPGVGSDNFSVRWTGTVEAPVTGLYVFTTRSDDGVRLKLNGSVIIDDWSYHAPTERHSSPIHLTAGSHTALVLEYFEGGGGAEISLQWQPPGQSRAVIPFNRLYADTTPQAGVWQTLVANTGILQFWEENDEEGNGTGNWGSSIDRHDFLLPGPGTLRVHTSGAADTVGSIYHSGGGALETGLDGQGDGANFFIERPVPGGAYYVEVGGNYQWSESEAYTVYVEFRPDATPPVITSPLHAATPVGANFSYQITASPPPVTFGATGLPPGLTLNTAGLISGRPTQPGLFPVQLSATNDAGTDAEILTLSIIPAPPEASISASTTSIAAGQSVVLSAFGTSAAGTLNYLNIDQVAPYGGYYGNTNVDDEYPPSLGHYASPDAFSHLRHLTLTLNTPGTYRFRASASDSAAWYPSAGEVTISVTTASLHPLTVLNGSGGGTYAAGSVIPIIASPPPAGYAFSHWSVESGAGSLGSAASAATTFTLEAGPATVRANWSALPVPVIVSGPAALSVTAGQDASFVVTASGTPPLAYQWRKDGQPLADGGQRSGVATPQLTVTAVTPADAGAYDVIVSNAAGATTSGTARLFVTSVGDDGTPQLRIHRAQ